MHTTQRHTVAFFLLLVQVPAFVVGFWWGAVRYGFTLGRDSHDRFVNETAKVFKRQLL